ncbi:class I SAM-dependent methyltransferase [Lapillicoccus sp.]|uniref:class I SAM-dependent methyltransferase n=1 Tax=Lapillicoccus sp. TaxID=1909287 RepID=UPI0025F2CC4D|nr:class I SAM-dependent methyltransferase [Lapillicoccus sp.]
MNPDELTRSFAADPRNAADPTAWFDQLYTAAGAGAAEVPWDRGQPNVLLVEWVDREQPPATGRTVVVGAGYGRDSEYLAGLGFTTTAFDISPAAVGQTKKRFPDSLVEYAVGDLLALPAAWRGGFDLVVESMTVQALPEPPRDPAISGVVSLVAPGGTLLVIAAGHDGPAADRDALDTPPWPLLREEVESFARDGLEMVSLERVVMPTDPGIPRWRATLRRP